jgi:hypothetical protein
LLDQGGLALSILAVLFGLDRSLVNLIYFLPTAIRVPKAEGAMQFGFPRDADIFDVESVSFHLGGVGVILSFE